MQVQAPRFSGVLLFEFYNRNGRFSHRRIEVQSKETPGIGEDEVQFKKLTWGDDDQVKEVESRSLGHFPLVKKLTETLTKLTQAIRPDEEEPDLVSVTQPQMGKLLDQLHQEGRLDETQYQQFSQQNNNLKSVWTMPIVSADDAPSYINWTLLSEKS